MNGVIIADFTADSLAGYLNNDSEEPAMQVSAAPFFQTTQVLLDGNHAVWKEDLDFAVVWTQPETAAPSFGRLANGESVDPSALNDEVDHFIELIRQASNRIKFLILPTWNAPRMGRGLGPIDLKHPAGIGRNLLAMNSRLMAGLSDLTNVYLLDSSRWLIRGGISDSDAKLWYMAKTPYALNVFREAARDIKATARAVIGQSRKLVIVDLDETLWGDIVGDVGWENIRLGGHDPVGEALVDFQRALKALKSRGVLLAIVSKNDEDIALDALRRHPEMVLREDDFVGRRINWDDKAQNIVDLVSELNLGLQSVVFIDDSPQERARVTQALPEVLVPDWPNDKMLYAATLRNMTCFDSVSISDEDAHRTDMYLSEKERGRLKTEVSSIDDWLKSLRLVVTIKPLETVDLDRTVQLLNKTNQMNLSTRRMGRDEFQAWANRPNHHVWTVRVADKFGDSGLTGIASLEQDGDSTRIIDFVLSCRVMGRRVETTMLHFLASEANELGAGRLVAQYLPTAKNKPCLQFLQSEQGVSERPKNTFEIAATPGIPMPEGITLNEV
jgi:FkbH-like protein